MTEKTGSDAAVDRQLARLTSDLQARMKKLWYADEWEALSSDERRHLATWLLELIESDLREAMETEMFGVRGEEHVSRTVSHVDARGWREINQIQDDALLAILAVKAESAERLAESGEDGMCVLAAMFCFEMAERSERPLRPE